MRNRSGRLGGLARGLWGHTGWARLGRIAAAVERLDGTVAATEQTTRQALRAVAAPAPPPMPPLDTRGVGLWQRMGLSLLLDGGSLVDQCLAESGAWEPCQIAKLRELAYEAARRAAGSKVFLDIGAYFGLYALLFDHERVFDRIVAYEPDKLNFAQLQAQLFLNRAIYRIEARNVAVGEKPGRLPMHRSDRHPTGNRGGVGMWGDEGANSVPTEIVAIDDEISIEGGLVVAKIDVEGGQDAVLRGMRRTIGANHCVIQVEAFEPQRPATLALLDELGLTVVADVPPDLFAVSERRDRPAP